VTEPDDSWAILRGQLLVFSVLGSLVIMQLLVGDVALKTETIGGQYFIDFRDDNLGLVEVERWRYLIALWSSYLFHFVLSVAVIYGVVIWIRKEAQNLS